METENLPHPLDDAPTYHHLPSFFYWLGRALDGLGSPGDAKAYETLLEFKAEGANVPFVADARHPLGGP